jgi:hypothetical protein
VHSFGGPPKLAEDETLYWGEGAKAPGEQALLRVGNARVVLGVELAQNEWDDMSIDDMSISVFRPHS